LAKDEGPALDNEVTDEAKSPAAAEAKPAPEKVELIISTIPEVEEIIPDKSTSSLKTENVSQKADKKAVNLSRLTTRLFTNNTLILTTDTRLNLCYILGQIIALFA
jgi:hypothetical protein